MANGSIRALWYEHASEETENISRALCGACYSGAILYRRASMLPQWLRTKRKEASPNLHASLADRHRTMINNGAHRCAQVTLIYDERRDSLAQIFIFDISASRNAPLCAGAYVRRKTIATISAGEGKNGIRAVPALNISVSVYPLAWRRRQKISSSPEIASFR